MYNLPVEKLDVNSAAESLKITGYSFQTRAVPPPMWGGVTGYGTDHVPWWIQKEMLEKKDRKIKRLENQVEKQKKEMEQLGIQLSDSLRNNTATQALNEEIPIKEILHEYQEVTVRCVSSINKLDIILRKIQELQRDIVNVDTSPTTRFIILKLKELEKLDASD